MPYKRPAIATKTILITGGSRGIGRATGLIAGTLGWSVALSYQSNAKAAEETAAEIEALGGKAFAFQADSTDEGQTIAFFDAAEAALGALDGVVVNAGVVAPSMPLAQMEIARIRRVVETNVIGAFLTAREAARRLPDSPAKDKSIVLVSSTAARLGAAFEYTDYAATKGAMDTLTLGLSKELAEKGVRVNAVRPGIIDTDIHGSAGRPDRAQEVGSAMPMGRPGTAEETAEAIIWLLSDRASYTTGTHLDINGGR